MAKAELGLTSLKLGPIAVDGDMGTVLTPLSATVVDTVMLTTEAPTETDLNIEEQDVPFFTISIEGKMTLVWSSYDVEPESLVRVLGGTVSADVSGNPIWEKPDVAPEIEQSVELITKRGSIIQLPRVKITAVPEFNFRKSDAFKVNLTGTVLLPTKAGVKSVKFTKKG